MTHLSIIIVSYNTESLTLDCVKSVQTSLKYDSSLKAEILLIDNASTDNTIKKIKNHIQKNPNSCPIRIISNNNNVGFGKANNQGIHLAKGNTLLFLNSDTIALKDAVPKLYRKYVDKKNRYDFLGAKLFNPDLTPQPSCGPEYTINIVFAWLFLRGDYWGITRSSPQKEKSVAWVSGACFITDKSKIKKVGCFDERIFMYMEEIELFMRAKKYGFRVGFYPNSHFIHLGSGSSKGRSQPIIQVYQGLVYLYNKHYSRFATTILKIMLKCKAIICILFGKVFKNQYLVHTYEKALTVISKN